MAVMSNLLKLILKPIILKLGKGLKSTKTKWCLGEEIDLRLDDSVIGKGNVTSDPPTRINSLVRWEDSIAKIIKDGIISEDDDGSLYQSTVLTNRTLTHQIENNAQTSSSHAKQEIRTDGSSSGNPFIHWAINRNRDFSAGIDNNDDDSWKICNNYNLDNNHFFKINKNGNISKPFQWTAFAVLTERTGDIPGDSEYLLGQGTPMTIIVNRGGFFYPGEGNNKNNPASFTFIEDGLYIVYIAAIISVLANQKAEMQARIQVIGSQSRSTGNLSIIPSDFGKNSVSVLTAVNGLAGDKLNFSIFTQVAATWNIENLSRDTYSTYIGLYCLG